MIKNILKSNLYVLCSMLFCSLVVSVFCFGISSNAASAEDIDNAYYEVSGKHLTDSALETILNYWSVNQDDNLYMLNTAFTSYMEVYCFIGNIEIRNDGGQDKVYCNGYVMRYDFDSWNNSPNSINSQASYNNQYSVRVADGYQLVEISWQSVNWDSPFYSANIPNPNIYVSYRDLSSTPVIDVPLNVSVAPFPIGQNVQEYYVQMFALVNMDFNYYVQNTRDGIVYNGLDMEKWTAYFDVVTPQDYKVASDLSEDYIHLALSDGWYNNYPQDSSFSFSFADGIPLNLQSSAITKFHNFRKNATFADNTVYLYVRYFVIDDNDNFVVGPWTVWKSYNPNEFYAELPSFYVPYNIVPGTQGTNSNVTPVSTASPEPSVIVNPVNTNPGVNVTVNQNVPNYPDYPTIASYNKDNLLVDTMNQLGSIQTFFGEFGSFLVTAFAFMPAWIWAIIGVGFSLSIVVMFLKIL